jgi:hypothetical protein
MQFATWVNDVAGKIAPDNGVDGRDAGSRRLVSASHAAKSGTSLWGPRRSQRNVA